MKETEKDLYQDWRQLWIGASTTDSSIFNIKINSHQAIAFSKIQIKYNKVVR